ncbi:MAG: flagellar biosynthesis protein FlgB [Dysosmobacter sp.]
MSELYYAVQLPGFWKRQEGEKRAWIEDPQVGIVDTTRKEMPKEKMERLASNSMMMLQRSMEYLWSKQTCILDNIANAETPGYQTKYATFEESLQQAIQSAAHGGDSPASMREAIEQTPLRSDRRRRARDWTVMVSMSQSRWWNSYGEGYQMQYVMNAMRSDFSLLRTAING